MKSVLILLMGCLVFSSNSQLEKTTILKELIVDNSHHWNNHIQGFYKEVQGETYNTYPAKEFTYDSKIICRKVLLEPNIPGNKEVPKGETSIEITFPDFSDDSDGNGGVITYWETPITLYCDSEKKDLEKKLEKIINIMEGYDDESSQYYGKKRVRVDCDENGKNCSEVRFKKLYWKILDPLCDCQMKTTLNKKEVEKILKWLKKNEIGDDC
tara:strand:- start:2806 stop:3441 length:636 start_codon:yes stop_codon:yes gene_type:complete